MNTFSGKRGWMLVLCGTLLLLASGTFHSRLIAMRQAKHLQQVAPEDTTPLVALTTVAFGGFRGLVADALWVRANKMQEEGQYFEMVQLAKWITQLEPRVPEVWSFQAWNLAYNISVLFPDFEDRWRWVNHGLDLLRKKGLTHNPNSPDLHWDIGWMFQHKIGMEFDLAHRLYKQKLKEQVLAILPEGKLDTQNISPETAQELKDTFAMDSQAMIALEKEFGPLQWQIPYTHTLYWATRGLQFSTQEMDNRRLRRMQMQALAEAVRGGRMISSEDGNTFILLPRLELIDKVVADYEELIIASPKNNYLKLGYTNFLRDALLLNADYGKMESARAYYDKLAATADEIPPGAENFQRYVQYELTRDPAELNYNQVMSRMIGLLTQSMEIQDPILVNHLHQRAKQMHRAYQESRLTPEHLTRTGLPPFPIIETLVRKSRKS